MRQTPLRFGARLRELRERAGIRLNEIAAVVDWSVVYLSDIERGRRNPPEESKIRRIAEIIQANYAELVDLANKERKRVELDLDGKSPRIEMAALMLARSWKDLTEDQAIQIQKILEGKDEECAV
jgi:transcriptional regulator with XRE-family HTH domain